MSGPSAGGAGGAGGESDPRQQAVRDEVRRWLRFAFEDLRGAEEATRHGERLMPRHACFLAQQCAEKALKALLILESIPYARTHDLAALHRQIPSRWLIASAPLQLNSLSQWAVAARYPGNLPEATDDDADEAIKVAREVYELVEHDLAGADITL